MREYLKDKINELVTNSKNKHIRDLLRGINEFKRGYQPRRPPLWSSGQSSWLLIRRPGFDFRHYQQKKNSGSGTGSTRPREYN
jgi:hypothetical protein